MKLNSTHTKNMTKLKTKIHEQSYNKYYSGIHTGMNYITDTRLLLLNCAYYARSTAFTILLLLADCG